MDTTRELAKFVAEKEFEEIPKEVTEQAKLLIIDTLGCGLAGFTQASEEAKWVIDVVKEQGGIEEATVFCDGFRTSAANAALANSTIVHTIDFDDTHMASLSHLGSSLVPAIFAMGERAGASGPKMIAAFILGFEAAARIGRSVMPSHYKFWHPTGTAGIFAAAVAAGKILNFNPKQMEIVIGHAADQTAGLRYGVDKGDFSKSLHPGFAAMKGILLALLVEKGATGPIGILEYPSGFCHAYCSDEPDLESIVAGLGSGYEIMEDGIKAYPTILCSHSPIQATLEIIEKEGLKPADIEEIHVRENELAKGQGCNYSPETVLAARLSIPFCLGLAVCEGNVSLSQFTDVKLRDSKVKGIMDKVKIEGDPELNVKYPDTIAAFVDVKTKEGKIFKESVIYPRGNPKDKMDKDEVMEKFKDLALSTLDESKVNSAFEKLIDLDKIGDITEVIPLLIK